MPRRSRKKTDKILNLFMIIIFGLVFAYHREIIEVLKSFNTLHYILLTTSTLFCITTFTVIIYFYRKESRRKIKKTYQQESRKQDAKTKRSVKQKEFLSPAEKEFKTILEQHLPDGIEIHCKVRLADVLKEETKYRRLIMMHIDFLLLDKKTQNVILAIELDDQSHNNEKAKERDTLKNQALTALAK